MPEGITPESQLIVPGFDGSGCIQDPPPGGIDFRDSPGGHFGAVGLPQQRHLPADEPARRDAAGQPKQYRQGCRGRGTSMYARGSAT
ncbi:MAG: hypothetical protein IPM70_07115 [Proteobacteria bacterium]|nr:hypothetical protein [Pseudomonadota bacterium]